MTGGPRATSERALSYFTIEKPRGAVSVWSLGKQRFLVETPGQGSEVEGFEQARARGHELAKRLE